MDLYPLLEIVQEATIFAKFVLSTLVISYSFIMGMSGRQPHRCHHTLWYHLGPLAVFKALVNNVLHEKLKYFVFVFMDVIFCWSLQTIFNESARSFGVGKCFFVLANKCECVSTTSLLGLIISAGHAQICWGKSWETNGWNPILSYSCNVF